MIRRRVIDAADAGKFNSVDEWSRYGPEECCVKLTRLLQFDTQEHHPFRISAKLLQREYREGLFGPVRRAWFDGELISKGPLEAFYNEVIGEETVALPHITQLGDTAISWFVYTQRDQMYMRWDMDRNVREGMVGASIFPNALAMNFAQRLLQSSGPAMRFEDPLSRSWRWPVGVPSHYHEEASKILLQLAMMKASDAVVRTYCKRLLKELEGKYQPRSS
jgi:hypothetical protein